jgi:N-acetylglucosaminyl-diphospho-decaprenol L-rhamnosyltransferase
LALSSLDSNQQLDFASQMAKLDIVIVDYVAGDLLRRCVRSLAQYPPTTVELESVVLVDNAPGAHSLKADEVRGLPLRIVSNETNRGFGPACNQGARLGSAEYILFLNPDTRITEGALDRPIAFLEQPENARAGIVSVQLIDDHGRLTRSSRLFPRPAHYLNRALGLDRVSPSRFSSGMMADWDHRDTRIVDQVMGAYFLVRRSLFESLGGFDERFFVYFEEVDLSLRARQAGYHSVYLTDAQVFHTGLGTTQRIPALRLFYSLRSRTEYSRKHFGAAGATAVTVASAIVEPMTRVALALTGGSAQLAADTLHGYRMYWRWLMRRNGESRGGA